MVSGEEDVFLTPIKDYSGSVSNSGLGRIYRMNLNDVMYNSKGAENPA